MAAVPAIGPDHHGLHATLVAAVDGVIDRDADILPEPVVRDELAVVTRQRRRLEAREARLAHTLHARETARLRDRRANGRLDHQRADGRAAQQLRRELTGALRLTPSEAKRRLATARAVDRASPQAAAAFDAGDLPETHARVLADTLKHLHGDTREQAQARLLEAATTLDAVTFGRTCRRVLGELNPDALAHADRIRAATQRATLAQNEHGTTHLSAQLAGLDAEYVHTAIHAYRRPDRPGEHRHPEQATAEALVDVARAALDAGTAPEQHGARPHVLVTIDYHTILRDAGVAETAYTGPIAWTQIRTLLADAGVSRILVDPRGVPVEVGTETRNVPAGTWRAIVARDQRCVAIDHTNTRCDIPAAWCDAMHLDKPYRDGGRLSITTGALGCRHHHTLYDKHGWTLAWHDGRPRLTPPPRDGPSP